MALSLTDALNQYGFVGDLANSIPELKGIFATAARDEWDPARFQRAVMDSKWWKTSSESVRTLATQSVTDPATYKQTVTNATQKIFLLALEMGLGGTPGQMSSIAKRALANNWDDEQIRHQLPSLGLQFRVGEANTLTGNAAMIDTHLRQLAADYGVATTNQWLRGQMTQISTGVNTLDAVEAVLRNRAKAAYPQFAAQLDGGMTLRDIADPYISTMANTLEISETEIDLNDPEIKRALTYKGPDGGADGLQTSAPLWQFERILKNDPRWDRTKQARTQAFDMLSQIGRDFGFEAGS